MDTDAYIDMFAEGQGPVRTRFDVADANSDKMEPR